MPPLSYSQSQCANCTSGFFCQKDVRFTKISFEENEELDISEALSYIYGLDSVFNSDSKYPSLFELCGSCVSLLERAYTALRHFENTSHLNSAVGRFKDKYMVPRLRLSTTGRVHPATSPIQSYSFGDKEQSDANEFLDEIDDIKYIPSPEFLSNNYMEKDEWEAVENVEIKTDVESQCKKELVVKLERLPPEMLRLPIPTYGKDLLLRNISKKVKSQKSSGKEKADSLLRPKPRAQRQISYDENEDEAECPKIQIKQEEDSTWSPSNYGECYDPEANEIDEVVLKTKIKSPPPAKKRKYEREKLKDGSTNKVFKYQMVDIQCPICGKMVRGTSTTTGLNKHLRFSHGILSRTRKGTLTEAAVANDHASSKRVYYCEICSFAFNYKYRFLRHLKDKHLNKEIEDFHTIYFHYCDFEDCKASFPTLARLHTHLSSVHSSSNSFTCNKCQRIFSQECNLKIHSKSHEESSSTVACRYCHMVLDTENELADHTLRHEIKLDMSTYCHVCDQCGEAFQNEPMLKKHHMNMHTGKVKAREARGKPGENEGGSSKSKTKTNNKFFCETCDKTIWCHSVKGHMYSHTNPDGFQCPDCTFKATTPFSLRNHQIRDHSAPKAKPKPKPKADPNTKPKAPRKQYYNKNRKRYPKKPLNIPCDFCGFISKVRCEHRKHIVEKHHEQFPTLPFHCKACFCLFECKELLNTHVDQLHAHLKCKEDGCGKVFSSSARMAQHLNIHYNRRPFKCPHCDATFTNQGNAFNHVLMVHEKYRSIRCKLCPDDQGFYRKQDFRKHVEKYHPGVPVEEIIEHKKHAEKVRIDNKEVVATYPDLFTRKKRLIRTLTQFNNNV